MTVLAMDSAVEEGAASSPRPGQEEGPGSAEGFAARLLADGADHSVPELGRRLASGLALAALYGLALGARQGGTALVQHAVGVPLGLLLVAALGGPSMFVLLSICRAPIDARAVAQAAVRGVGSAGIMLAGLAPSAALFVVSSETPEAARAAVLFGLLLGGGVALARTVVDVARSASRGRSGTALGGATIALGFGLFAILLAARVWTSLLPILRGGS